MDAVFRHHPAARQQTWAVVRNAFDIIAFGVLDLILSPLSLPLPLLVLLAAAVEFLSSRACYDFLVRTAVRLPHRTPPGGLSKCCCYAGGIHPGEQGTARPTQRLLEPVRHAA